MEPRALYTALLGLLLLGSCRATDRAAREPSAWSQAFAPPVLLETGRVRLEPLAPRHVELDFAALMGSREHLRRTLRWGDWPRPDFTLQENRADLARHWGEFERREAYAYTVLAPDRSACVGCIYLVPDRDQDPRAARLALWVVEEQLANDLDCHLLGAVLGWIDARFPIDSVAVDARADDARGARILADAGLAERPGPDANVRTFVWTRARRP